MKVVVDPVHAAPVIRSLAPATKRRVKAGLRRLGDDPSGISNGLDVKRLDAGGGQPMYRLRLGDWRVAFTLDREVVVLRVFHRSEGYGWMQDMP